VRIPAITVLLARDLRAPSRSRQLVNPPRFMVIANNSGKSQRGTWGERSEAADVSYDVEPRAGLSARARSGEVGESPGPRAGKHRPSPQRVLGNRDHALRDAAEGGAPRPATAGAVAPIQEFFQYRHPSVRGKHPKQKGKKAALKAKQEAEAQAQAQQQKAQEQPTKPEAPSGSFESASTTANAASSVVTSHGA